MSETGRVLKPANENPWYVLMTLYGEQDGDQIDKVLHEKNRSAWNAWACQRMSDEERSRLANNAKVEFGEIRRWADCKDDITERYSSEIKTRNGGKSPHTEIPNVSDIIDLRSVALEQKLSCSQYIFSSAVNFDGAFFDGLAKFDHAIFKARGSFAEANFKDKAFFGYAKFENDAYFYNSTFAEEVWFGHTVFEAEADFSDVTFKSKVGFTSVIFKGFCYFIGSKFDSEQRKKRVTFGDSQFLKPCSFLRAEFRSSYPEFLGTILHEKTSFSTGSQRWPTVSGASEIVSKKAKASCAAIRHNLGKQGLPEEEHFFFRREMGFAAQIGGWWQRLPYRVFGAVSDFGYSIQRPALWLFGLWLSVALINYVVLQWAASKHCVGYHFVQAFGLSFANQFPVFGLQSRWFSAEFLSHLNPWLKALGGAQTVVALPLLFFFALGLRTRFRMR